MWSYRRENIVTVSSPCARRAKELITVLTRCARQSWKLIKLWLVGRSRSVDAHHRFGKLSRFAGSARLNQRGHSLPIMNIHYWLGSLRSQHRRFITASARCALAPIMGVHDDHFGELLSLGSLRLHRPTWPSIAAYHDVFSTAPTHCACLRDSFLFVQPRFTNPWS